MARRTRELKKAITLGSGTTVPAGTKLRFGTENTAYFAGEQVEEELIPDEAFEEDGEILDAETLTEAFEQIEELIEQASEDDDESVVKIIKVCKDASEAFTALIDEETTNKSAIEDGYGDMDVEQIEILKESVDEVIEKLETAQESGDTDMLEDALEQVRSIFTK